MQFFRLNVLHHPEEEAAAELESQEWLIDFFGFEEYRA